MPSTTPLRMLHVIDVCGCALQSNRITCGATYVLSMVVFPFPKHPLWLTTGAFELLLEAIEVV